MKKVNNENSLKAQQVKRMSLNKLNSNIQFKLAVSYATFLKQNLSI